MVEKLSVGQAMGQATEAMRKHLLVFAAPLVIVDCLNRGLHSVTWHLFPQHSVLADFANFLIVCLLGGMFAEVVVARMFLADWSGRQPGLTQVWEVARYPRFLELVFRLSVRYLAWGLLAGVVGLFVLSFANAIRLGLPAGGHGGRVPGEWIHVGVQVGWLLMSPFFCRYAFALPLFAQRKRAVTDLIVESIARVRPVWRMVALVSALDVALELLPYDLEQTLRGHFSLVYGAKVFLAAASTILIAVIRTCFVMVVTGLMLQTETPPAHERAIMGEAEGLI